jgi:undecaprenyl diphosphate synthase
MLELEEITKDRQTIVNLAINYGGRDEIVHAFNTLIAEGKSTVTEDDISGAIYTKDSPPVDMIVRTGGDIRISNFLLWQAAYAELYFIDTLWPDLTEKDIDKAVEEFNNRNRRFGGV